MNEAYRELLAPIMYRWVSSMEHIHECKNSGSLCVCNEMYHARITFYKDNVIELSIRDKKTEQSVFYLHFEMQDFKTVRDNIQLFFQFLKEPYKKEKLHQSKYGNINILLSCTTGLTTSYFAYLMQEALQKVCKGICIDAVSYLELDKIESEYDYILLAPQISYKFQELKKKYGSKVMVIDAMDFASNNVNHVINQIMS